MAIDAPGFDHGDQDADACCWIARMAGLDTLEPREEARDERVLILNNGKLTEVFDQLLQDYDAAKTDSQFKGHVGQLRRHLILFCVKAMELGATFTKRQLAVIRCLARELPTMFEQMLVTAAADEYKNDGTQWVMESHIVYPQVPIGEYPNPFIYLNGPGHSIDEPEYPHAHTKTCLRCGKHDPQVTCGVCEMARYCEDRCQQADLQRHEKVCKPPGQPYFS